MSPQTIAVAALATIMGLSFFAEATQVRVIPPAALMEIVE